MRRLLWIGLLLSALFAIAACEKAEVATVQSLTVPNTDLDEDWKKFVSEVAKSKNVKGKTTSIFMRFLGAMEDPAPHLKDTQNIFNRGAQPGTLLVFGSNNSRNMADLLVTAFSTEGIDGKLTGTRLVFVGHREHEQIVRDASIKSGVTFEFYPSN